MASAWGQSWGVAWGVSWGTNEADTGINAGVFRRRSKTRRAAIERIQKRDTTQVTTAPAEPKAAPLPRITLQEAVSIVPQTLGALTDVQARLAKVREAVTTEKQADAARREAAAINRIIEIELARLEDEIEELQAARVVNAAVAAFENEVDEIYRHLVVYHAWMELQRELEHAAQEEIEFLFATVQAAIDDEDDEDAAAILMVM